MKSNLEAAVYDLDSDVFQSDTGRSNFVAFLIGGLVIGVGLIAFLFYDDANISGRDVTTTGSLPRIETPVSPSGPITTPTSPAPTR